MMDSSNPDDVAWWGLFPAKLLDSTGTDPILYEWEEQQFSGSTGDYDTIEPARRGYAAREVSNRNVDITDEPLVWMRTRGVVNGALDYEFLAPAGTVAAIITVEEEDGTPSYGDINTVQFDQADFAVTNPSAGVALITFTGSVGGGGTFDGARVTHSAAQSISSDTATTLAFDTESGQGLYDTGGYHDNTTNNSRLTVTTPGYYAFGAMISFDENATGGRYLRVLKVLASDATQWLEAMSMTAATPASSAVLDPSTLCVSGEDHFAAGDYLFVQVKQISGGLLDVIVGSQRPLFWISLIAAD